MTKECSGDNMFKNSRILGILPESIGGRLTTSSILDGFEQNGIQVDKVDKLDDDVFDDLKHLNKNEYDFIVSYDYVGVEFKTELDLDIPTINYFSDVIADNYSGDYWQKYHNKLKDDDNYTFYWDEKLTNELKTEIPNIFYLPHCVNTEIYKNLNLKPEYDVMFAGRLIPLIRLQTILNLIKKFPHLKFALYCYKSHFDKALETLENSEDVELLNKAYTGFIETEEDMAVAINKTHAVLNFNTQAFGALNYRTFQVIACEKLLLNDDRSELFTLFTPNEDVVYYKNTEELEFLIGDYFKNPQEYSNILKNGRKTILEKYSSKVIVSNMIETLKNL